MDTATRTAFSELYGRLTHCVRDGWPLETADVRIVAGLVDGGVTEVCVEEFQGANRLAIHRADGSKKLCSPAWVIKQLKRARAELADELAREELPKPRTHRPATNPAAFAASNVPLPDTFLLKQAVQATGLRSHGLTLCTLPPLLQSDFTIKCTVRIDAHQGRGEFVHTRGRYVLSCTDGWWNGWVIEIDQQGIWAARLGTGTDWVVLQPEAGFVELAAWTALAVSYEAATGRLSFFLNGVCAATERVARLAPSAAPLRLAAGPHGTCGSGFDGALRHLLVSPSRRPSPFDTGAPHLRGPRYYPRDTRLRRSRHRAATTAARTTSRGSASTSTSATSPSSSSGSASHSSGGVSPRRVRSRRVPRQGESKPHQGQPAANTTTASNAIMLLVAEVSKLGGIVTQLGDKLGSATSLKLQHRPAASKPQRGTPNAPPAAAAAEEEDRGYLLSPSDSDGQREAQWHRSRSWDAGGMQQSLALRRSSTAGSLGLKRGGSGTSAAAAAAPLAGRGGSQGIPLPRPLSPSQLGEDASPRPPLVGTSAAEPQMSQSFTGALKRSLWDAVSDNSYHPHQGGSVSMRSLGATTTAAASTHASPLHDTPGGGFADLLSAPAGGSGSLLSVSPAYGASYASPRSADLASRVPSAASSTTMLSRWRNLLQESDSPYKRATEGVEVTQIASIVEDPLPVPEARVPEGVGDEAFTLQPLPPAGGAVEGAAVPVVVSPAAVPEVADGHVVFEDEEDADGVDMEFWLNLIKSKTVPDYGHKGLSKPAEVRPGIFFGDGKMAKKVGDLTSRGVKKVVNLAPSQCRTSRDTYFGSGIEYLEIQAVDDVKYPIMRDLPTLVSFIDESPCYIHCFQGVNRSAVLVAGYIMCICRVPLLQAIQEVFRARPVAFQGNDGFLSALIHHAHRIGLLADEEGSNSNAGSSVPSPRSLKPSQASRVMDVSRGSQSPTSFRTEADSQAPIDFMRVDTAVSGSTRDPSGRRAGSIAFLEVPEAPDQGHSPKHGRRRDSALPTWGGMPHDSGSSLADARRLSTHATSPEVSGSLAASAATVGGGGVDDPGMNYSNYAVPPAGDTFAYTTGSPILPVGPADFPSAGEGGDWGATVGGDGVPAPPASIPLPAAARPAGEGSATALTLASPPASSLFPEGDVPAGVVKGTPPASTPEEAGRTPQQSEGGGSPATSRSSSRARPPRRQRGGDGVMSLPVTPGTAPEDGVPGGTEGSDFIMEKLDAAVASGVGGGGGGGGGNPTEAVAQPPTSSPPEAQGGRRRRNPQHFEPKDAFDLLLDGALDLPSPPSEEKQLEGAVVGQAEPSQQALPSVAEGGAAAGRGPPEEGGGEEGAGQAGVRRRPPRRRRGVLPLAVKGGGDVLSSENEEQLRSGEVSTPNTDDLLLTAKFMDLQRGAAAAAAAGVGGVGPTATPSKAPPSLAPPAARPAPGSPPFGSPPRLAGNEALNQPIPARGGGAVAGGPASGGVVPASEGGGGGVGGDAGESSLRRRDSWAMQWLSDADFSDATPEVLGSTVEVEGGSAEARGLSRGGLANSFDNDDDDGGGVVGDGDEEEDGVFTARPRRAHPTVSPLDPSMRHTEGDPDLLTFTRLRSDGPDAIEDMAISMSGSPLRSQSQKQGSQRSQRSRASGVAASVSAGESGKEEHGGVGVAAVPASSASNPPQSPDTKTLGGIHQWDDWD